MDYPQPDSPPDYGISSYFKRESLKQATVIFLHGTTWDTKHWPDNYWVALAERVTAAGFAVRLPWGNEREHARAKMIAANNPNVSLIPKGNLLAIATALAQAQAVVGVDTGLAHLTAALAVPSVTLYGPTKALRTGTYGPKQAHLQADFPCAPCFAKKCTYHGVSTVVPACYQDLSVEKVWATLYSKAITKITRITVQTIKCLNNPPHTPRFFLTNFKIVKTIV